MRCRRARATIGFLVLISMTSCGDGFDCRDVHEVQAASTPAGSHESARLAVLVEKPAKGSDEMKADRMAALEQVLDYGFDQRAEISIVLFGGTGDAELLDVEQLIETGNNDLDCSNSGKSVREKVLGRLDETNEGPVDLIGGINELASSLKRSDDRPLNVVIVSSMINDTEVLHAWELRDNARTEATISDLRSKNFLRDCTGWQIHVVGPGETAGGGPPITLFADLNRFWDKAFRACGGGLWAFQSRLTDLPAEGPMPPLPAPSGPCATQTLPAGSLFFGSGSAELREDIGDALDSLASYVGANVKRGGP